MKVDYVQLLGISKKNLRQREDAEDAVQQAYLNVMRLNKDKIDDIPYMITCVMNEVRSIAKKRQVKPAWVLGEGARVMRRQRLRWSESPGSFDGICRGNECSGDFLRIVTWAGMNLPEMQWKVLAHWFRHADMTKEEAAEEMGIHFHTYKTHLRQAKLKLVEEFPEYSRGV